LTWAKICKYANMQKATNLTDVAVAV